MVVQVKGQDPLHSFLGMSVTKIIVYIYLHLLFNAFCPKVKKKIQIKVQITKNEKTEAKGIRRRESFVEEQFQKTPVIPWMMHMWEVM